MRSKACWANSSLGRSPPIGMKGDLIRRRPLAPVIVLIGIAAGLGGSPAGAQAPVELELEHRSAESLLPALRVLAAPVQVQGSGSRLEVRADPADLPRLRRLVQQADRPPRPLRILTREDPPPGAGQDGSGDSAAATDDRSVTLSTGSELAPDRQGNAHVLGTRGADSAVYPLEGEAWRVSMPAPQSLRFFLAPGAGASIDGAGGAVYFDARADFVGRAWLVGNTVAVELSPVPAGRVSAATHSDHREARPTMVVGRLSQWLVLADSGLASAQAGSGARTGLWIKVQVRSP